MPDYRAVTKVASLVLAVAAFASLAALDPKGRRHAWLGLGTSVGLAMLVGALWVAAMFGAAIAARHWWQVPPLRTLCVGAGLSLAAAYATNSTWVWNDWRMRWLVRRLGQGVARAMMIAVALAVVLYGIVGPAHMLDPQ